MLKLESVYYLGICFERFFLAHGFNANQTKQVDKQKSSKEKTEGRTNGREMKESILNRLQVNNTSTKCFTVWVATPLFIRFFDIGNYYISCSYLGIVKVVS